MDKENSLGPQGKNKRALALEYLNAVDGVRLGGPDDLTSCPLVGRIRLHGVLAQRDRSARWPRRCIAWLVYDAGKCLAWGGSPRHSDSC